MIALYKGKSIVSGIIRWITWGQYSHASWIRDDYKEYESWQLSGVVFNPLWGSRHTPGTEVDLYDFRQPLTCKELTIMEDFMRDCVGEKYDWAGVLAFLPIIRLFKGHNDGRWFCSEFIAEALKQAGRELYEKDSYKVSPSDIAFCPLLKCVGTWTVPDRPKIINAAFK